MLPDWYFEYKELIDKSISNYLDNYFIINVDKNLNQLKDSVYYSVKGGKKIRSILALEFYLTNSGNNFSDISMDDDIIKYCIALEFIQAYSLIHDDLPCMDNDDYRRGELSVWKKYGEDIGTLVGDLLNSLAFEIIGEFRNKSIGFDIIKELSSSIGYYGMIGGQVLDIYYEGKLEELSLDKIIDTHNKKTGALIKASIIGGLILSNKNFNMNLYIDFGYKIGLAFQVKDDLGEKNKGKDHVEEKGFVYFIGEDKTKEYLEKLRIDLLNTINVLNSSKLNGIVNYICEIKK